MRFADTRALELLGCADGFELERLWERLKARLEGAGLSWNGAGGGQDQRAALDLAVRGGGGRGRGGRAACSSTCAATPRAAACCSCTSLETLTGLESDLRLTSQMRSVSQISPAVAHDLRAPINAMVFNIEILKEMLASGRATDPANKDKLLRYVNVLKEELSRLHRGMEIFLAYISPRGDRDETLDLRELAEELAALLVAPARKQQAQVEAELPEEPVPVDANRYLLRQALLHLALAALTGVPKQGALHVLLERQDGRARLRLYGVPGRGQPGGGGAAQPEPPAARVRPQLFGGRRARPALGGARNPCRLWRRSAGHRARKGKE